MEPGSRFRSNTHNYTEETSSHLVDHLPTRWIFRRLRCEDIRIQCGNIQTKKRLFYFQRFMHTNWVKVWVEGGGDLTNRLLLQAVPVRDIETIGRVG